MTIGKLTRVPLREVWKHEAHDFTTWRLFEPYPELTAPGTCAAAEVKNA